MSEVRKALDLMKRADRIGGDRGARRLALELGTLALDRGDNAAQRAGTNVVERGEAWSRLYCICVYAFGRTVLWDSVPL